MWKDVRMQTPTTMSSYSQAMDKFTKSATAFMENVHHLTQARAAYEEAMQASTAMRASLDAGDQALRSLMKQLQEAVNLHIGEPATERKRPEAIRVEAESKANGESTGGDKAVA